MKRLCGLLLATLLAAGAARAAIDVIDLRHRTAEQLIPSLQGVVDQDVTLRADGFRLIVRGSDAQIDAVRSLVDRLDTASDSLRISVRRTRGSQMGHQDINGGIDADSGGQVRGSVRLYSSTDAETRNQTQTVRAVAGRPVHIDTGGVLLLRDEFVARGARGGGAYGSRVHPLATPDGFYAMAVVSGDEVSVDISVEALSPKHGAIGGLDRRSVTTRLRGRLGEWIPLGTVTSRRNASGQGIARRSSDADASTTTLELRVQRTDNP